MVAGDGVSKIQRPAASKESSGSSSRGTKGLIGPCEVIWSVLTYRCLAAKAQRQGGTGLQSHCAALGKLGLELD